MADPSSGAAPSFDERRHGERSLCIVVVDDDRLIAISGLRNDAPDRMIGAQMGFDHHLAKPCDPHEVIGALERHVLASHT